MTKYHENHSYENCRLIKMNESFSNNFWREILKKIGLDLLCVAVHYSKRYENSDKFIENKYDDEIKNYAYYLKNSTPNCIVSEFCNKYIITSSNSIELEWKNLHFLWKQFLSTSDLPNIIYSNSLKNILKEIYKYNETTDTFIGITSKYLPIQSDFIKFWECSVNVIEHNDFVQTFNYELEIDEICSLFKSWTKSKSSSNGNISEENVVKILKHFFPNIEIVEDKYVLNVTCTLWDKNNEIEQSFDYIKTQIKSNNTEIQALISFDDAYNHYYKYCNMNSHKSAVVSKRYFEKYLYFKLSDYIVYEKFIEASWVNN
jgi:hypothetical protein